MYGPRIIGTILCAILIAESISRENESALMWICLALNAGAWPHIAYCLSKYSKNPYIAELHNLRADSLFCGVWIGVMGMNPLSSIAMSSMVAMNATATGGIKALKITIILQLLGLLIYYILFGIKFEQSTLITAWASLPLLTLYPMTVGLASYKLSTELHKIKSTLNRLSITDGLTGLINRRHFDQTLIEIATNSARAHQTFLAVIDIDHFKEINDTYGHPTGDSILRLLSRTLKNSMRSTDLVGRLGGDEFCVVMNYSTADQAVTILNRILMNFKEESNSLLGKPLTISIGVAGWQEDIETAIQWFAKADELLYLAKKRGRDRIEIESK
ncbi:diguanylate cyclase [Pseudomonas sp. NyZ201]|uniref:diguanylate cyclase n=1 Tax=Pseudomonas sp. NyZ201 TaxID=3409857 RepID=UPI003CF6B9F6